MVRLDGSGLDNADWAKQSWDLGLDNIDDLLKFIKGTGSTPKKFMELPVYKNNVAKMPWLKELTKHVDDKQ